MDPSSLKIRLPPLPKPSGSPPGLNGVIISFAESNPRRRHPSSKRARIADFSLDTEPPYHRFRGEWDFDFRRAGKLVTVGLIWEENRRTHELVSVEEVFPSWNETNERESVFPRF